MADHRERILRRVELARQTMRPKLTEKCPSHHSCSSAPQVGVWAGVQCGRMMQESHVFLLSNFVRPAHRWTTRMRNRIGMEDYELLPSITVAILTCRTDGILTDFSATPSGGACRNYLSGGLTRKRARIAVNPGNPSQIVAVYQPATVAYS